MLQLLSPSENIDTSEGKLNINTHYQAEQKKHLEEYFVESVVKIWASGSNNPLWYSYALHKMFKGRK